MYNYLPADDSFLINCKHPYREERDPVLTPIRLSLPEPPELEYIAGYGLDPFDQVWVRPETPERLVLLENRVRRDLELRNKDDVNKRITAYKIVEDVWEEIEANKNDYEKEIEWIKTMWWHRLNGYWFFCKGKPTYINGWHFFISLFGK